ncbi:hypothetical protein J4434_03100 [Candidatus Woesearchaeota archaeon]|nr:hypothetical protein [Candidatus Woesearchaeota archaeon]
MKKKIVFGFSISLILFLIFTSGCANQDVVGKAILASEQNNIYWICMKNGGCIEMQNFK